MVTNLVVPQKVKHRTTMLLLLLLLLSHFSRVRLCVTPQTAAHQAPRSLGFSRQEHWSGLPFPPPMHESEKWKWSRSVVSDSSRPHGLQPTRLLHPWDFQARVPEWGAIAFSKNYHNYPAIPVLGIYPKELKAGAQRDTFKPMFIVAYSP